MARIGEKHSRKQTAVIDSVFKDGSPLESQYEQYQGLRRPKWNEAMSNVQSCDDVTDLGRNQFFLFVYSNIV